jgi:8-oxo-dGTP pyrophosphatase MutT (NUDIX family)
MGDGDGWVRCAGGHRHWGRFGAAGLMLAGEHGTMLQHRAAWTHEGGTWGVPGGARDSHEDVVATALREASEEAGVDPAVVVPVGWSVDDHGGWSYTTVVAHASGPVNEQVRNAESTEIRWWAIDQVASLPLHQGFATTWPRLQHLPQPLARAGVDTTALPDRVVAGGLTRLLPRIVLVVEGQARVLADDPTGTAWWDTAITVARAERDGDAEVVRAAADLHAAGTQTVVVSSDRGLRARLASGVLVAGPRWLMSHLPVGAHRDRM